VGHKVVIKWAIIMAQTQVVDKGCSWWSQLTRVYTSDRWLLAHLTITLHLKALQLAVPNVIVMTGMTSIGAGIITIAFLYMGRESKVTLTWIED